MKEVKIEYNKIFLPFYCGLTAFSNLLQHQFSANAKALCCGLTAFSNLLQLAPERDTVRLRCGLTAFSNLLQQTEMLGEMITPLRLDRIF